MVRAVIDNLLSELLPGALYSQLSAIAVALRIPRVGDWHLPVDWISLAISPLLSWRKVYTVAPENRSVDELEVSLAGAHCPPSPGTGRTVGIATLP